LTAYRLTQYFTGKPYVVVGGTGKFNYQGGPVTTPQSGPVGNVVQQGVAFSITGTGYGTKSDHLAPGVFDNGTDTAVGGTSGQWNGGSSKLPILAGGIYNIQNQLPGFSPGGTQIGGPHPFGKITAGCHRWNTANGGTTAQTADSNSVELCYYFSPPNNGTTVTYPFCSSFEYYYRGDPAQYHDMQSDNNNKTLGIGDGTAIYQNNQYCYWDPYPISNFPIDHITNANPCVVHSPMNQAGAFVFAGNLMGIFGVTGTTGGNVQLFPVTSVTGNSGNWTITLNVDSTSWGTYPTLPLTIVGITNASPPVVTINTVSATHPLLLAGGQTAAVWLTGIVGMTHSSSTLNQVQGLGAINLGGVSGAWYFGLEYNQYLGDPLDTTAWTPYTSGGAVAAIGGLSTPYNNASQATFGFAMNPINQLQNPDAAGHGMGSLSALQFPFYAANGWIRRRCEICWTTAQTTTPGYFRIYDNNVLVFNFVGQTDNLSASTIDRWMSYGSIYGRDRSLAQFWYLQGAYFDWSPTSLQVAKVYAGDNAVYSSCTILVPQPNITSWTNTNIAFSGFNQEVFANGATIYFHCLTEAGTVVSSSAYTITATSTPTFTTASLPGGTHGVAYTGSVAATGGTGSLVYTLNNVTTGSGNDSGGNPLVGPSPNTYVVNSSTGAITGTPGTAGTDMLFFTVTDANGWNGWIGLAVVVS
jgi:hypothetical protein